MFVWGGGVGVGQEINNIFCAYVFLPKILLLNVFLQRDVL